MPYLALFLIAIPLLLLMALMLTDRGRKVREYLKFITTGLDSGFSLPQILFLGKVGRTASLEDVSSLFWSVSSLDSCIAQIVQIAKSTGTENEEGNQKILTKLYDYRTKIELEQSQKKHGLDSTRDISAGQRIRILLRGTGLFTSKVIRVGPRHLVIEYPLGGSKVPGTSVDWVNKKISVYFWRHDDAGYVFDTAVVPDPTGSGTATLYLAHSYMLIRSQKRRSIRVKCSIYAQLYLFRPGEVLDSALEPEPGMKCLLEDLSEDGAMILIGGKAEKAMRLKLQFMLRDVLIVMCGIIRGVDYNRDTNQSRIHFESEELNPRMRNAVLTFVYNVLPEEEKDELDAIRLTEEDGLAEAEPADDAETSTNRRDAGTDTMDRLPDLPDFAENAP